MRTSDVSELRDDVGLARKPRNEASAWRKRRIERPKISLNGIPVVRRPRRRLRQRGIDRS